MKKYIDKLKTQLEKLLFNHNRAAQKLVNSFTSMLLRNNFITNFEVLRHSFRLQTTDVDDVYFYVIVKGLRCENGELILKVASDEDCDMYGEYYEIFLRNLRAEAKVDFIKTMIMIINVYYPELLKTE